ENKQLVITYTLESQKDVVNRQLIPLVKKTLNKKTFPVTDDIIKHIIHERHRHQREHNNNRLCGTVWVDREKRRKHANTRRTDVSKQSGYFLSLIYFLLLFIVLLFIIMIILAGRLIIS